MFKNFLTKLQPVKTADIREWQELLESEDFNLPQPSLFWYPASGMDLKSLVHFSEQDTNLYGTPTVDFFILSDYSKQLVERMNACYICFDKSNILFQDSRTKILLMQMIPLKYFADTDRLLINQHYKKQRNSFLADTVTNSNYDFMYCLIEIESNYFGSEYFHVFFSSIETWTMIETVWKPENIKMDYVVSVNDGCRKGGAYKCSSEHLEDFLPIMSQRKLWITDHNFEFDQKANQLVKNLNGWAKMYDLNKSI